MDNTLKLNMVREKPPSKTSPNKTPKIISYLLSKIKPIIVNSKALPIP